MTILRNRVKSSHASSYTTALPAELVSGYPSSCIGPAPTLINNDDLYDEEPRLKVRQQIWKYPEDEEALWVEKATGRQFSGAAACCESAGRYTSVSGPIDPISGVLVATYGTVREVAGGIADYPIYIYRTAKASRDVESCSPSYLKPSTSTKGLGRIVTASLSAPRDITLALTEVFHNAPKIYGDEELRQRPAVVGLRSGIMAAGKGLVTGLYDGLSGFLMQPIKGAKEAGASGFAKGVGKGIGGLNLVDSFQGACGVPGYALEGIHVELRKSINKYLLKR
ncbi:hypothetical protein ACMFMG_001036 [Clarireedia jacksonii]